MCVRERDGERERKEKEDEGEDEERDGKKEGITRRDLRHEPTLLLPHSSLVVSGPHKMRGFFSS